VRRHAVRSVVVACPLVVLAALPVVLPVVSARTPAAAVPVDDRPPIVWRECGRGFECGTLAVPLDSSAPDGPALGLAVVRAPARDRRERIGSLVVNPGGPGAPGVAYVKSVADSLPAELRDRFDIVGFDPRGVGASGAVSCETDIDPLFDEDFAPSTADARARLVDAFAVAVAACSRSSGDLLPHVATVDTARDLDALRSALGDPTLSFVGQSYGTYLGTVYASLFPSRVRALVFDGAIDPGADGAAVALGQARGFEQALHDFLADCAGRRSCPFRHDGEPGAAYDALRARTAREPIPARSSPGRSLNRTRFDAAVLQSLYSGRAGWSTLADALADADGGDASALLARADAFVTRGADGHEHRALDAFWAISCLDGPIVGDVDAAARLEARAETVAPRVGAFLVNFTLAGSMWPVAPVTVPTALTATGAPAILVVGTTRDPATPLESARLLTRSLDRARLLVAAGEQHASFAIGNRCVDRVVTRYLVDRTLPAPGTRC
jgi:pimeloyl-ACP methyl ester carboxylesterase